MGELPVNVAVGLDAFEWFEVQWQRDDPDPGLVCTRCELLLCDVDHRDTLMVLCHSALAHVCPNRSQSVNSTKEGASAHE